MTPGPVSVGYFILTLLQVTKNAYGLIDSIKDSAPKVQRIKYRILAEKATTEGWVNQMRIVNGRNSALPIPPDKLDEVTKLLSKLVVHKKNTITNLRAKALFIWSAYDDLKDIVAAMASMNKALLTIAPALPSYSRQMCPEGSTRPHAQHLMLDDGDTNPRASEAQPSSTLISKDGNRVVKILFSRAPTEQSSRRGHDYYTRSITGLEHLPTLKSIYELCLNAMDMMAHWGGQALLQNSAARLKLWGAGIFELPLPLDTVLMLR